jgi:hypothetical protein
METTMKSLYGLIGDNAVSHYGLGSADTVTTIHIRWTLTL